MSSNRIRLMPWIAGKPGPLSAAELAERQQYEAELAAEIERRRDTLRRIGTLTPEQVEFVARSDAQYALRDREIAERGMRRHGDDLRNAAVAAVSLGLTWELVQPTWEKHYASAGSTKRADAETAKNPGDSLPTCSASTIKSLRLEAGRKTKKKR